LRKRITDECWNHGYVIIVLNKALLSSIRFCGKTKPNNNMLIFEKEVPRAF
jgi:hypothetical protein